MMKFIAIVWSLLLVCSFAFPQQSQWMIAAGTFGIPIQNIVIYISDPDTLYAMGNRFMISTDRGKQWDTILAGPSTDIGALQVDPFDSKRIYASHYGLDPSSNDISMTTDGGVTWQRLFIGRRDPSPVVVIDPMDYRTVYAVVGPGFVHRSTDRGGSWQRLDSLSIAFLYSMVISPTNDSIMYFGSLYGVYKSTDKGQSFFPLSLGFQPQSQLTLLALNPQHPETLYATVYTDGSLPGGVFKSTDGGVTWTEKNNGLGTLNRSISALTLNPENPEEIFIGTGTLQIPDDILFRSTNGGEDWSSFRSGLPDAGHVGAIAIDTLYNRLYVGVTSEPSGSGIYIFDRVTSVKTDEILPHRYALYQNYPNPFNPETRIQFILSRQEHATLEVYNLIGQKIQTLLVGNLSVGKHWILFNGTTYPSGVYFYRLTTPEGVLSKRMVIVR
ncbi:MAG: T9SS type A sorting domain-containing protein [Ignavibacteriae bacterium]|nr:T9SS type A sorting domain-containing protein [Ignavibacteriota bacterium]